MDISDVRKALWDLHEAAKNVEFGLDGGKSSEGCVSVLYPAYWDCKSLEEFQTPRGIEIYSYLFGPSRTHYITRSDKDRKPAYYHWESPDIYKKAVEVIEEWKANLLRK